MFNSATPLDNLSLVTACLVLVSTIFFCGPLLLSSVYRLRHIPSPSCSNWLLGHLLDSQAVLWSADYSFPQQYLAWLAQCGDVFRIREGLVTSVVVADPTACQHILTSSKYPRITQIRGAVEDTVLGTGLLTSNGAHHDSFRKLLNPLFTATRVQTMISIAEHKAQHFCDTFLAHACDTQAPVDYLAAQSRLSLDVLGLGAIGFNLKDHGDTAKALEDYVIAPNALQIAGMMLLPAWVKRRVPGLAVRQCAQDQLKATFTTLIEHSKRQATAHESPVNLLNLVASNSTEEEARVHLMTFLIGGQENTSTTMAWIWAMLVQHPDAVAHIREEYHAAIAQYGSLSAHNGEGASQLKYTMAVINETMRLYSVALFERVSQEDDFIPMMDGSKLFLPKGTSTKVHFPTLHRNPKYWILPDMFVPARFLEGSAAWQADLRLRKGKSHRLFFMPFGLGSMQCIAYRFVLTEMRVTLATMASQFDVELTENADLRYKFNGFKMAPVKFEIRLHRAVQKHPKE
ncbi:Aste57867_11767 [Aphanomyces stellatus]|uniref:Aste57867_11767 protein n=1 Tax=Aphanomyces stellatus TaxID=120398 RepID=A0A485KTW0_9STRA|nr:hypothetical protein As57867_011722 [Aphanomyces stellatus]VFT88623.1 Aste57867_11767 [Aphanomyces stellatus]